MKAFLSNPPWRKGKLYGVRAGSRWPFMMELDPGKKIPGYMPFPFFLAYAAALLEKNNIPVSLVDAIAEGLTDEEFLSRVKADNPEVFLIETSTPSINTDLAWIKKIREALPSVKTIMTGTHATVFSEQLINDNPGLDFVISGEYEFTLLELVKAVAAGSGPGNVRGVTWRKDGKAVKNPAAPLQHNLDDLPWPAREFLPMLSYNDTFSGFPSPNVQVWASRGCPFGCVFCNWPSTIYGGPAYRVRNYKDVVDEVEWLIKKYGFKGFNFDDDTFNIGKERILNLCGEIKKRGLNVPWAAMARADTSDAETLRAMKEAGLWAIKFGVESGVQEVVDECGKKLDLGMVRKNVKEAKALGIKVHLTFTFGLPNETEATIKETIRFVKDVDPTSVQFSIVTPFPGTPYYDELKAKSNIMSDKWEDYDGANVSVIRTENLSSKQLEYWCSRAIREWNWHMMKTRLLKKPFKTLVNAVKKPGMAWVFLKGLLKR